MVYDISECPSGTSVQERVKRDLDSTIPTLTKLNPEINPSSIRDCFRLGKYKPNPSHLYAILMKLNHSIDVTTVLSKQSSIENKSIIIKPDISPDEKQKRPCC